MVLSRQPEVDDFFHLSPYVWKVEGTYHLAVRVQDPKTLDSFIAHGVGEDGRRFEMARGAAIAPGSNPLEKNGCEDPTVVPLDDRCLVFYTGWNRETGIAKLMQAMGPTFDTLEKHGRVFPPDKRYAYTKEPSFVQGPDRCSMFFEYADGDLSRIGLACAGSMAGPWRFEDPLVIRRKEEWDLHHLSTGPVLYTPGERITMFYNGSDEKADWRIGWIEFDTNCRTVLRRGREPLIRRPPEPSGMPDIAFAASVVVEGEDLWLYYSIGDQVVMRARLRETDPDAGE